MTRTRTRRGGHGAVAGAFGRVARWLWFTLLFVAAPAETLKIATYNVANYVAANRMTEAGYRRDYPKPENEKRALRQVIAGLAADILVLQEMGPAPYLDELQRDLRAEGVDYPHRALALAADTDRHVAILSRRPLQEVSTRELEFPYFGGRERVKRGLLEATIRTAAGDVTLFALHLKSRFTERPDDPGAAIRRAGEAAAIRDHVLHRFPVPAQSRFLLLGDCNDGRTSKALAFLQKRGRTTVTQLLPAADSRGEVWTYAYRKEETYSRVDLILVSPGLAAAVRGGAAEVYDGPGSREASDHRPVSVILMLEPGR